jgi:hypothetical protein
VETPWRKRRGDALRVRTPSPLVKAKKKAKKGNQIQRLKKRLQEAGGGGGSSSSRAQLTPAPGAAKAAGKGKPGEACFCYSKGYGPCKGMAAGSKCANNRAHKCHICGGAHPGGQRGELCKNVAKKEEDVEG